MQPIKQTLQTIQTTAEFPLAGSDIDKSVNVGRDIRALRKARGMTLVEFANSLNRSLGFVSQIERGLSEPAISDLRNIAALFNVPISFFFGEVNNSRHIVRADQRRKLGNPDAGLIEELLSPDLGGSFEIIRSEFAPSASLDEPQTRDTEEAGYIISGQFDIEIDGNWHSLHEGDSFRFSGEAYRWRNTTQQSAIVIWVVSPPVY
ncbi:MAG: XRE family transcriptional regulator [Pseudomonadota bacterium]